MPAKLVSPIEIVTKEAVLVDSYRTTQIIINLKGNKYVTVTYDAKDKDGNIIGTAEAILDSSETDTFIANNLDFYEAIKEASYKAGKFKGVIPSDAGVI